MVDPVHRPTVKDVARTAGVSAGTVSNVLYDHPEVTDEKRQRTGPTPEHRPSASDSPGMGVLAFGWVLFLIPETKNRSLGQIGQQRPPDPQPVTGP
ncbi:hypothetical protein GCM10022222_33270 [Amycolatopsis ultiminotia]|uniref:HTH lacI-type domain-containing protein n=1 Tax=Amycolatopsis ultiminotia TaxID=543629 RepID=A0ABP6W5X5_9PSEU